MSHNCTDFETDKSTVFGKKAKCPNCGSDKLGNVRIHEELGDRSIVSLEHGEVMCDNCPTIYCHTFCWIEDELKF